MHANGDGQASEGSSHPNRRSAEYLAFRSAAALFVPAQGEVSLGAQGNEATVVSEPEGKAIGPGRAPEGAPMIERVSVRSLLQPLCSLGRKGDFVVHCGRFAYSASSVRSAVSKEALGVRSRSGQSEALRPNNGVNRTARKRRLRVPSSLRSSAAGYAER